MSSALRIGARPSALARAQAEVVSRAITQRVTGLAVEVVPISTSGDKMQTASLARIGGKGLFIRELEQALTDNRIDVAVHSMKDLPAILPLQFRLAAVPPREAPYDVLLSRTCAGWASLPAGARLGTSSVRRRLQALRISPSLEVLPLRGNVDTRLERLRRGNFDAIILAAAGLRRLGLGVDHDQKGERRADGILMFELDMRDFVPSGGQGALAVEAIRASSVGGSAELEQAIAELTHPPTLAEITAERAFLATIGASCVSPVGVHGRTAGRRLTLHALLFSVDGERSLSAGLEDELPRTSSREQIEEAAARLGERLGGLMLERGADKLVGGG
jgi:hydroxymethylbilane synthase